MCVCVCVFAVCVLNVTALALLVTTRSSKKTEMDGRSDGQRRRHHTMTGPQAVVVHTFHSGASMPATSSIDANHQPSRANCFASIFNAIRGLTGANPCAATLPHRVSHGQHRARSPHQSPAPAASRVYVCHVPCPHAMHSQQPVQVSELHVDGKTVTVVHVPKVHRTRSQLLMRGMTRSTSAPLDPPAPSDQPLIAPL